MAAVAELGEAARAPDGQEGHNDVAAEFEFLLGCCRAELSGGGFPPLIDQHLNWAELLKIAEHHRVIPAIYAAVSQHRHIAPAVRNVIRERFHKHAQRNLRLSVELSDILQALEQRGIEAVPYKGPIMAHSLFGDVIMRQFGDLDLLVCPTDVFRVGALLRELGYTRNLELSPRQEEEYLHAGNELGFGCERGQNLIELQWQILPRFYAIGFNVESLFSRSVQMTLGGRRIRVLAQEDLMLVLCAHAAKHEWEHLGMLRDITALARFELDWKWTMSEASRLGISRILKVALLLASDLLSCRLPSAIAFDSQSRELASLFESRIRACKHTQPTSLAYFRNMFRLRERRRDRARSAWRLALTPNVSEWNSVTLGNRFFLLYRGVRVLRLCRRFLVASDLRTRR